MRELAPARPRHGYRRRHVLLGREGWRVRIPTVVDIFSRECLALEAATSVPSTRVTLALDRVMAHRRTPGVITLDNGTEVASRHFDARAYQRGIRLDVIRPGRPVENAFIESFHGRLRDECLNTQWWVGLDEARRGLEDWGRDDNETRPHSS